MPTQENSSQALATLQSFIEEMYRWESEFFSLRKKALTEGSDSSSLKHNYRILLEVILRKYVAEDNRNFGRLIDIGCTHPPTYDLKSDTLRVEPSEPGIIVITVQQTTGVESLSRITLNLRQGGWIIKKKETLDHKDKWRRSPL